MCNKGPLIAVFGWLTFIIHSSMSSPSDFRLIEHLLYHDDYDSVVRPVPIDEKPLNVSLNLELVQIVAVDQRSQVLHLNIWVVLQWIDSNFIWDPLSFGNITVINLPIDKIWRPDILVYNCADENFNAMYPSQAVIVNSGQVTWNPPGMFASTCAIDITWFPFDEQQCRLKFGSWTFSGDLLNLTSASHHGITDNYQRNGEWDLIDFLAFRSVEYYECCPNTPWIDITYVVHIRRRPLYYMFNLVLPCIILSLITLTVFTLPPEGGKIGLAVTVMLSLVVFMQLVANSLPPTSDAIPLIGLYFMCTLFTCGASLAFTVYMLSNHNNTAQMHGPPPRWICTTINTWLAWLLGLSRPGRSTNLHKFAEDNFGVEATLKKHSSSSIRRSMMASGDLNSLSIPMLPIILRPSIPRQPHLNSIVNELKFMNNRSKEAQEEEAIAEEWRFAAHVIDRLCFITFTCFNIGSSVIVLLSAPNVIIPDVSRMTDEEFAELGVNSTAK